MRGMLAGLLVLLATATAPAAEQLVAKPAPDIDVETWLAQPEGPSLVDLHGRVVVLLSAGALDLADADAVLRWNDLRAAYLEKGLRVVAVLSKQPDPLPDAVTFSVGVGLADAYGSATATLIGADGTVAWTGAPGDLPEDRLAKLLKKAKPFALPKLDAAVKPVVDAFRKGKLAEARTVAETVAHADKAQVTERIEALVGYWQRQVTRATEAGDRAEAALYLGWLAKHLAGAREGTEAAGQLKTLKADKSTAKESKALGTYARLRSDVVKAKGKRKKLDALAKSAERSLGRHKGTRGAERMARLITAIKADPALSAIRAFIAKEKVSTKGSGWRTGLPRPPEVGFAPKRKYLWSLETSEGTIEIRFFPDVAPMHVSSMIYLTELGFFDGLTFHRVIPGFMAQGGCPAGTGSGDPGYKFAGEFDDAVTHDKAGILSMANAGPGTDGSQFFITFKATKHLDGKHTVFGEVVDGMRTLEKMEKLGSSSGSTSKRIVIEKATIRVE